jgi:cytochrome c-type biogenesis protein CcsB
MTHRPSLAIGLFLLELAAGPWRLEAAQPDARAETVRIVRGIAIQHQGRVKPFDSFAREVLDAITGRPQLDGEDPVATVLSVIAEPEPWQRRALIAVPFVPLREQLGMDRRATHIAYDELVATRRLMRQLPAIVEKQQRDEKLTLLEHETMDAFQRFVAFNGLIEQRLALVAPPGGVEVVWRPIRPSEGELAPPDAVRAPWEAMLSAWRAGDATAASTAAAQLARELAQLNPGAYPAPWRRHLELAYNRAEPFRAAQRLYLLAAVALAAGLRRRARRARRVGFGLLVAAFAVHAGGIAARVVLGGRPPVSNFFETMLWLPFVGVLLALVFERIYRAAYFGLAAALLAGVTLLVAGFVPLDSSITPVVAVLRSNLWLTVHVLTIVASYGALALATVLAHLYGGRFLLRWAGRAASLDLRSGRHPERSRRTALRRLDTFLYRAIQVGVVLLAGGIMLGAVWANASWGRYWGWDPKETWALITLLWYLALLHGRFAGWIQGVWVAVGTILGFYLLLITYYGVSFYLVGLHSYAGGHAKPLPPLLIAYLIAESAFLLVVSLAALRRQRAA